jgi:hypothetical protein
MAPKTLTASIVAAVIWLPANAHAQDEGALPMAHGIYVEADTPCAAAQNANIVSYWGDQLNSAYLIGHIRNVDGSDDIYTVTLDLEGDGGMGGDLRDQVEWLVITDEGDALLIDNGIDSTLYMWCAASMDDLDQMRQEQANAAPVSSAEASSWVPMQELRTDIDPSDSSVAQIWQTEMQAEADAIRSRGSELYVQGEPTILPEGGFRPTYFLTTEFETEDANYVVSIMFQHEPACNNGPNTFASTQIHADCPARLATIPKDGVNRTRSSSRVHAPSGRIR